MPVLNVTCVTVCRRCRPVVTDRSGCGRSRIYKNKRQGEATGLDLQGCTGSGGLLIVWAGAARAEERRRGTT
jgi:hypothetical protein